MVHAERNASGRRRIVLTAGVLLCVTGCTVPKDEPAKLGLGVSPTGSALTQSASFRDTIGSFAYYDGMGPMRVRGYGLVVGLGKNGSSDCPRNIYDRLVQNLYKQHRFASTVVGEKGVTPEQLIADPDTAVVIVYGEIPPAAVEGTRFDVFVSAVPGTQTKSLLGGRLFTTDLEVFRDVGPNVAITGQILAHAAGPVFINPFSDGASATKSSLLEGTVIGGGVASKERRLRLVLTEPSYPRARQIQDRINAHFGGPMKVADANSPSFVQLRVPPEYHKDTGHFLALVRSLYLTRDPLFEGDRARLLGEELVHPAAPHAQIAWAFEGLGRSALPVLGELYGHAKEHVSFHAAVAGMRLGDHVACDCMTLHAMKKDDPQRFPAIRALGDARAMGSAAVALRKLLHDEDPRVRIEAYETLLKRGDATVGSKSVGGDSFVLDRIETSEPNLIYVKRSGARRIALFGEDLHCVPPLLYRAPDGSVMINAENGDSTLTLLRTVVASGTVSPSIHASLALPELVRLLGGNADIDADGHASGLGLDYGAVVRALHNLCEARAVNAAFVLEQPNAAEMFPPTRAAGRPESEF